MRWRLNSYEEFPLKELFYLFSFFTFSLESWIICISRPEIPCEETKAMTAKITKRQIFVMLKSCRGFLSSSFVEIWFSSVERDELSVTQKYFQVVHLLGFGFVTEISLVQIVSGVLFLSSMCSLTSNFYFDAPCTQVTISWSRVVYLFGHALGWKNFQHVTGMPC